jgi:two-component system, OmpR family, response regulator
MRLLVVEDEPDLQNLLARALRGQGYAVDTADDGEQGLYKAQTWDYDAIVLDWMLPKLDGLSLLRELRRKKRTPVLLLTARDATDDRVSGLDSGADDYLVKPFEIKELLARLRAIIRRSSGITSNIISIGEIQIDTGSHIVHRNGEPILLTAREYALVELLVLRRGKLVTRQVLYDHLFDENDDTLSNLIEVHVSNVRKKLGKDFISTRRGAGYIVDG